MRINKYIASCGVSSRRKAEELINQGLIKVNGKVVTDLATRINVDKDWVEYKNKRIKLIEKKYYLMLNKPEGYTSTNRDPFADKTIFDLINIDTRLFSIGRLDKDSSGLLLITNDGEIYNQIMHPINNVFKKYFIKLDKEIGKSHINKLEKGVDIGDYFTKPAIIEVIDKTSLYISISEGKNRQIRRMFDSINYRVIKLHRVSIGKIELGNLNLGNYRSLTTREINYLKGL